MPATQKKLILVVGATGAQGIAVVGALLAPAADGSPSPYSVRALTRDPKSNRALALAAKGVECFQGAFDNFSSVAKALEGAYGAWVNTDGFTVGEQKEIFCGIRIFELAKQSKSMRHYVWSNLDYALKLGNYNQKYRCEHYDGKGRVAEWLKAQPSDVTDDGMSWSVVTSGPYMDMLSHGMFGPLNKREDDTYVFATPIGNGHVPMIALEDLGFFARYTFDHRAATSTQDLAVASDIVGWDYLVATFRRVTGQKAVVVRQPFDEYTKNFDTADRPIANEKAFGDGSTTWSENFRGWWSLWHDDIVKRDMEWVDKVHPNRLTLEKWMRAHNYTGQLRNDLLKNTEDGKSVTRNAERISQL